MNVETDQFGDIYLHAASVREWSQTYSQLSRGSFESSLLQIGGRRFQIFRELINQRVVQHGEAPSGKICFGIPVAVPGTFRTQGREADERCVFLLQGGEEFMFHMPKGMDLLSINFDRDLFEQAVAATPHAGELLALLRQPVLRIPPARLGQSRRRFLDLFDRALLAADARTPETELWLEQELMSELIGLLTDPECDKRQRHSSSPGSYIVAKCHRLTVDERHSPPNVVDLCRRLRVSRRSVQNGFRSVAETTPVNYMRCIRLNGVRRELVRTRAAELTIGDAAARWGFFHLR
jgi:AraC-like DNA-binding protein